MTSVNWTLPGKPWEKEKNFAFVVSSISSLRYWQTPPPTLVTEMGLKFNTKVLLTHLTLHNNSNTLGENNFKESESAPCPP